MTNSSIIAKLDIKNCIGCGACVEFCPKFAIPYSVIGFISSLAEIDATKCDGCGKCVGQCPAKSIEIKGDKAIVSKDHLLDCHLCNACIDSCPKEAITVKGSDDFIFYLESWGQLDCKKILSEAARILGKKLDEFSEKLKGAKLSQ